MRARRLSTGLSALSKARTIDEQCVAMLSFAIGAAFALQQAIQLGFTDRIGRQCPPDYSLVLQQAASRLAVGTPLNKAHASVKAWAAGFFFNSALQRLAALDDRLAKYQKRGRRLQRISDEVNRLKHDVIGVDDGRTIRLDEALDAWDLLTSVLLKLGR